jgi:inhibitor of the pro-sigma K processing machinery
MTHAQLSALVLGGVVLVFLLIRWLSNPLRLLWRFAQNVILGCLVLYVIDLIGKSNHLHIGINPVTAGTVGVLGIPGVAALVAAKIWLIP